MSCASVSTHDASALKFRMYAIVPKQAPASVALTLPTTPAVSGTTRSRSIVTEGTGSVGGVTSTPSRTSLGAVEAGGEPSGAVSGGVAVESSVGRAWYAYPR